MNIKPGKYLVRPFKCTVTVTKAGDPQVAVELRHVNGLQDNPAEAPYGTSAHTGSEDVWFGSLKDDDKSEKTAATLRDCGWTGEDIFEVTFPDTARMVAVYQDDQDQNGNPVVRLRFLNSLSRGYRELPADRTDETRARVAAALRNVDSGRGRVPQSSTPRPVVPEVLRPLLANVPEGSGATPAALAWNASNRSLQDTDRVIFWRELSRRVPGGGAAITAELERMKRPATVATGAEPPSF